jgi:hypothetical protein
MGKTFRREKTFGKKRKPLNNHRDLPDYGGFSEPAEEDQEIDLEEVFDAKRIRSKESNNDQRKDTETPKKD